MCAPPPRICQKPVLVATFIKQATYFKQACIHFPPKKGKYIEMYLY